MPEGGKGDPEGFDFLPIAVVNMYFFLCNAHHLRESIHALKHQRQRNY